MAEVEVICVGAAKFDLNAVVDDYPGDDERVLAQALVNGVGGPAITAAVAIARLGVPVGFCGVVGRDAVGDYIMGRLEEEGVSRQWVERRADIATSGSMNIITRRKATRAIITVPAWAPDPATVATLRAPWLHFDDVGFGSSTALRKAAPEGVRFSIDGGNVIAGLDLDGIHLYAPTITRLAIEAGSPATDPRTLMQGAMGQGARAVVATDGRSGSYVLEDDAFTHVPGFDVEVVSTLGAGDVFHGALLAGLCLGQSLTEATRWANACAALSCRAIDGQSMVPRRPELQTFLASH